MFDKEGFLRDVDQWTPAIATRIADAEGIWLSAAHWEIIALLREYFRRYEASPANRALVRFVARELGPEKGRSIYLLSLFPESPARVGGKIAGLPKPDNCL